MRYTVNIAVELHVHKTIHRGDYKSMSGKVASVISEKQQFR
ncbi:hypothetical protein D083_0928 [Dickeya solani RNS 08.23.3.1.A]|nr:hypothetical protein D083_0928 [Dickeya solani RNS 08.23.3.1.A]